MTAFETRNFEYKQRVGWIRWPICLGDFEWVMGYIREQIDTSWEGSRADGSTGSFPHQSIEWHWEWKRNA